MRTIAINIKIIKKKQLGRKNYQLALKKDRMNTGCMNLKI